MSKILVDSFTQKIVGGFKAPYTASLIGKYLVDVPDYLGVVPETDSPADLYLAKANAFVAQHPLLPNVVSSESITSYLDPDVSSLFIRGPDKNTGFLPNPFKGGLQTIIINIPFAITKIFLHWYAFTLTRVPVVGDAPDKTLVNYDTGTQQFVEFDPNAFAVDIMDPSGSESLLTVFPDVEMDFVFGPGDLRLRFFNDNSEVAYFFSDFYFLFG